MKPLGEREFLSPSLRYAQGVAAGDWQDDPAQRAVLGEFDRLHGQLTVSKAGWLSRWRAPAAPQGIYLWGQVGRGKTMLMDL
ncbi:MAG TPA: AFG1/ZapE family ATPase, partial [Rhodanobacteraceae bacterium]